MLNSVERSSVINYITLLGKQPARVMRLIEASQYINSICEYWVVYFGFEWYIYLASSYNEDCIMSMKMKPSTQLGKL